MTVAKRFSIMAMSTAFKSMLSARRKPYHDMIVDCDYFPGFAMPFGGYYPAASPWFDDRGPKPTGLKSCSPVTKAYCRPSVGSDFPMKNS